MSSSSAGQRHRWRCAVFSWLVALGATSCGDDAPAKPPTPSPCAQVVCQTPPAPSCDEQVAVSYHGEGACQQGACLYPEQRSDCAAQGLTCVQGACAADPCAQVTCSPSRSCEADIAVVRDAGVCLAGECAYGESRLDCAAQGLRCVDGVCAFAPDPCAQIVCQTPPAPSCDEQVAVSYPGEGACQQGACLYPEQRSDCAAQGLTCVDGACVTSIVEVAAGGVHTCARRRSGEVACWGRNHAGQLGDDSIINRSLPGLLMMLSQVEQLAAGGAHTCALRQGRVLCWGLNATGQLGDGSTTDRLTPTPVLNLQDAVEIAAGSEHTCARRQSGQVVCWGSNRRYGQLGDGTLIDRLTPTPVLNLQDAVELAAGNSYTCARRQGGSVLCWGRNDDGQLGDGSMMSRATPAAVMGLSDAAQIVAGATHACVRQVSGVMSCWGNNNNGRLGDGSVLNRTVPTPVPGMQDVVDIIAGNGHTCAMRQSGQVSCWGRNAYNQLGDGTAIFHDRPTPVIGLGRVTKLFTGADHSCAIQETDLVCWGRNDYGQLGDGTLIQRSAPTPVLW